MIFIILGIIGVLYTYSSMQDVSEQREKLERIGSSLEELAQSTDTKLAQMAQEWLYVEKGNDTLLVASIVMIIIGVLSIIYQKRKS